MMGLYEEIKQLCPDMGKTEIERAMGILEGAPLLSHGRIPRANYGLEPVSQNDPRYEAACSIAFSMLWRCFNFSDDFCALASTQVGITFPIIVFVESETFIQHPRCKSCLLSGITVVPDRCGSLPKAMHLAAYPRKINASFYQLEGERERYRRVSVGSWFNLNCMGPAGEITAADYVHEYRHLEGQTAASNGWLLHPGDLSTDIWKGCRQNLVDVMRPENREEVLRILGRCESDNGDLELQGKRGLWAYLHAWKAKDPDAKLLLPTARYDPRPYRVVSVDEYIEELEKLF